jgi:hypothetical protein
MAKLTFDRLLLPPAVGIDRLDAVDERGWSPTPGDMDRIGTFGGGLSSAPGERRCRERCEGPAACIMPKDFPLRLDLVLPLLLGEKKSVSAGMIR